MSNYERKNYEHTNYEYKKRKVVKDQKRALHIGEGKISAYCSVTLGVLIVLVVLAYLYPSYLTTTELRKVYDAKALQEILKYTMYFSLFLGLIPLFNQKYRWYGFLGISLTLLGFMMGGYNVPVGSVTPIPWSLGVDWMVLALLGSVMVFMSLERLFPKYKNQVIMRKGFKTDLFYFCFNHLVISLILIYTNYHVAHFNWAVSDSFQAYMQSLPIWTQFVIALICADFVLYWEHRVYHEVHALWPIHAVHHSVEELDWLAGSRGHFIQVFSERAMVMVPIFLLGVNESVVYMYVSFAAVQAVLIHCNLGFSFGFLKYIFVTPQFHHWHHSSEKPAIDTNYSAHTVLFDWLFNTLHFPEEHWPAVYGTTIKLPETVWGQTLYPITVQVKKYKRRLQNKLKI